MKLEQTNLQAFQTQSVKGYVASFPFPTPVPQNLSI